MLNKSINIPLLNKAESAYKFMTPSERWLFYILSGIVLLASLSLGGRLYTNSTVITPASGGTIVEAAVGAPRFINPILAISQTDKDLSELIYSGLMTMDQGGQLIPSLAESYTVSEDSKEYTFTLRPGLEFHDGTPLTASDVIFTIQKALQPEIKSPERANWEGVTIEQEGELVVKFTLSKPYSQFLQNTTLGILPEEHWYKLSADEFIFSSLNTSPVGSGPYKFVSMSNDNSGIPSSIYLTRYRDYILGSPYIKNITLNFYSSRDLADDAFSSGIVSSISEVSLSSTDKLITNSSSQVITATLPRIFAVFFNQSKNTALQSKGVRKALHGTVDKQALVNEVLAGYAQPLNSPMIQDISDHNTTLLSRDEVNNLLTDAGWTLDEDTNTYTNKDGEPLSITLTTANSTELKAVAEYVANSWRNIGVIVKIEIFEPGDIANNVLRTRDYEALLFGEILGVDPDLYAFWHSSQRNDPGLNIANYANTKVDKLLLQAREATDQTERADIYNKISEYINADIPAVFLYAPYFLYIADTKILGIEFPAIMEPHNRFTNVHKWHIKTNRTLKLINN
jgi:peptide/nickel transport system substrate-binding protein